MFRPIFLSAALAAALPAAMAVPASAADTGTRAITIQSTTSTQNSGLLDVLLPQFTEATGIEVRVVAVGTGQAIRNAENGDGDVLLVHSTPDEEAFVAQGFGVARFDVMYNDFVVVGPEADPAQAAAEESAPGALAAIARAEAPFASRGDDSGTHKAELALWTKAGVDRPQSGDSWYRETGQGMGATLNIAAGMGAYTLSDRASWVAFGNKGDLGIVYEGDPQLFNQYGVILVNPEKHPTIHAEEGQAFVDWITGEAGQSAIAAFEVDGQQLFFPNAR